MVLKFLISIILIGVLFSCQKSGVEGPVRPDEGTVPPQPPPVIQGLKINRNYSGHEIYVEAALQEATKPKLHPFYFLEAEFVFTLREASISIAGKDTRVEVSGRMAYTNKDYTAFKVYMLKKLVINGRSYTQDELQEKKFVVFFDNGKPVYSLEQK